MNDNNDIDLQDLQSVRDTFHGVTKDITEFLLPSQSRSNVFISISKTLYDVLKSQIDSDSSLNSSVTSGSKSKSLKELMVKGFDIEQIWQQLDLHNDELLQEMEKTLPKLSEKYREEGEMEDVDNDDVETDGDNIQDGDDPSKDSNNDDMSYDSAVEDGDNDSDVRVQIDDVLPNRRGKSIVDDEFFSLDDMENFLIKEDNRELKGAEETSDNDVDLFDDLGSESDELSGKRARYNDFFRAENKKVRFASKSVEVDYGEDPSELIKKGREGRFHEPAYDEPISSSHERRRAAMRHTVEELEARSLDPKSWQMSGEAAASRRPENALLEEYLEFNQSAPPDVGEDEAVDLEKLIVQRIRDANFDDVQRKVKPKEDASEFKSKLVLDSEKSKASLAEIYETEYLKQMEVDRIEAEDPARVAIRESIDSLFVKLDALSNFTFAPRPSRPEVRIVANAPAVSVEEALPTATSDQALLAPQDIAKPSRGTTGHGERTRDEKHRDHRRLKALRRRRAVDRSRRTQALERLGVVKGTGGGRGGTGGGQRGTEKLKGKVERTKSRFSSTSFFNQLQDQVSSQIKQRQAELKRRKGSTSNKNSVKYKL